MTTNKITDQQQINPRHYAHRLMPDENGGYTATITEFPGCISEGDTAQEAVDNLDSAALAWIEAAISNGYQIREPIDFNGCNGKVALRIPRTLHKQALEIAELEGCSLNQLLTTAIASYLGEKRLAIDLSKSSNSLLVNTMKYTVQNRLFLQANLNEQGNVLAWFNADNNIRSGFLGNNQVIKGVIR